MNGVVTSDLEGEEKAAVYSSPRVSGNRKREVKAMSKVVRGRWTEEEHSRFLEGLDRFGKDWPKLVKFIGTRRRDQVV